VSREHFTKIHHLRTITSDKIIPVEFIMLQEINHRDNQIKDQDYPDRPYREIRDIDVIQEIDVVTRTTQELDMVEIKLN